MSRPSHAAGADVVVVGGGVVGAAVAWFLAGEGVGVTLFERGDIAGEASGAAAGMLAPLSEAEDDGPLRRRGLESLAVFAEIVAALRDRTGIDPEFVPSGVLRVAESEREAEALRARARTEADLGLTWLDRQELRSAAPGVAPSLRGALLAADECHVRSPLLVRAYIAAARQRGAVIRTGSDVRGLLREGGRVVGVRTSEGDRGCDVVVLCAGCWTATSAEWLGTRPIPIEPVRGQIVSVDMPVPAFGPIVWGRGAYLVPKRDGSLVIGATLERVGFDRSVTAAGVRSLLAGAEALVPDLGVRGFRGAWAGLRPDTPDHMPLVGPVPGIDGVVLAAGHYRNGVLLSPVTGRLVADGVLGKGWGEEAFLPERFLGD